MFLSYLKHYFFFIFFPTFSLFVGVLLLLSKCRHPYGGHLHFCFLSIPYFLHQYSFYTVNVFRPRCAKQLINVQQMIHFWNKCSLNILWLCKSEVSFTYMVIWLFLPLFCHMDGVTNKYLQQLHHHYCK